MTAVQIFNKFVPDAAVDYCHYIYKTMKFECRITKSRSTKLGDFKFKPSQKKSIITINGDLNSFAFLITYLHEVAHLVTFRKFTSKVAPHGEEWKQEFVRIVQPMLTKEVFPCSILAPLNAYFQSPKASSSSDPVLYRALRQFDSLPNKILLGDITNYRPFVFRKKRFIQIEKKRTRWVCEEVSTKRKYLISGVAEVELLRVNS